MPSAAAGIPAAASLVGGIIASKGSQSAASTQADAASQAAGVQAASADRSAALQKEMYDKQVELQDPYRKAGLTGQNRLMELMGLGGNTGAEGYGRYARDFGAADFQQDPGYAFRLSEGMKQLAGGARAGGGAVSGRTMMGAQNYAQGLASQEYGNAFQRYQTNRTNQLQSLGNLMTSGQAAASNQAAGAQQYGADVGNTYMQAGNAMAGGISGAGNAMAAGQLGQANTLASGLGTAASAYQNQNNFDNWLAQNNQNQPTYGYSGG